MPSGLTSTVSYGSNDGSKVKGPVASAGFWDGFVTMGRTVPTFRLIIASFGVEWTDFKRTLRDMDQDAFESLMSHARKHAAEGHNFSHPNSFEPIVMSILLEHEKQLKKLLKHLEKRDDEK